MDSAELEAGGLGVCLYGIDTGLGLRMVAGNHGMYRRVLERFRLTHSVTAAALQRDLAQGQLEQAERRVHTLRGAAGTIGAQRLQQLARHVEEGVARGAALAEGAAMLDALDAELAQVLAALAGPLEGAAAADADAAAPDATAPAANLPATYASGLQALVILQQLLAEFSGDSTDYFDGARAPLGLVLGNTVLERLSVHLSNYEFDQARQLLSASSTAAMPPSGTLE